jgi:hypothetical protein
MRAVCVLAVCLLVALLAAGTRGDASPRAARRALSERNNHRKVRVALGTVLVVTLHSTYWTFHRSTRRTLTAIGVPVFAPAPVGRCVPGEGCGTVTARYRAARAGSATVRASRTSCGEALACGPAAGAFSVTVTVVR